MINRMKPTQKALKQVGTNPVTLKRKKKTFPLAQLKVPFGYIEGQIFVKCLLYCHFCLSVSDYPQLRFDFVVWELSECRAGLTQRLP